MKTRSLISFLLAVTFSHIFTSAIPIEYEITIDENLPSDAAAATSNSGTDYIRIKRSGSGDIFSYIKKGITAKISQFAQASAGASAHFSKSSSSGSSGGSSGGDGGGYYYPDPHHDEPPITYGTKSFDFWQLKKSILNTLLQAVKAINGGIIAIKGQLIKGSGAIISAKGKIISMKGETIANLGKHIITNSKLSPSPYGYPTKHEIEITAPTGHTGPTSIAHPSPSYGPPPPEYGPPSAPSASAPTGGYPDHHPPSTYGAPTVAAYGPPIGPSGPAPSQPYLPHKLTYEAFKSKLKPGGHAGIVILKKIPEKDYHKTVEHLPHAALASLPLQDERHKVIQPDFDVSNPDLKPLFSSNTADTSSFSSPPAPFKKLPDSLPTLAELPPTKPVYEAPLDVLPIPNPPSLPSAPSATGDVYKAPTAPSALPTLVGPSSNAPNFGFEQPTPFNLNKPNFNANEYNYFGAKPPTLNSYKNLYLSSALPPFEINTFGASLPYSQYGLGALNNIKTTQQTLSGAIGPLQNDFLGSLQTYAPSYSLVPPAADLNQYASNLQYKNNGLLEHKGTIPLPEFDIVKSLSYDLTANKRQQQ